MKLRDIIDAKCIHLDVEARDPADALQAAALHFEKTNGLPADSVVRALLERERLGSTSVGHGFAIPHCKIDGLKQLDLVLVRFADPVDFGSAQDELVRFFFVVVSPPDQPAEHLQLLSQIARVLKRSELRSDLLNKSQPEEIANSIREAAEVEGL